MSNPFSLVYDAFWTMIERNDVLMEYFPEANRIKWSEYDSKKENISHGDLPEISLLAAGIQPGERDNNTARSCIREYTLAITTGDSHIAQFDRIEFELYRSLIDYHCVLCSLTWCNCNFVTDAKFINTEEGTMMRDQSRGIVGWSAIWTYHVHFVFPYASLKLSS